MFGIEIGSWLAATTYLGAGVPLLDPGPVASVFALAVAVGLMWHARVAARAGTGRQKAWMKARRALNSMANAQHAARARLRQPPLLF